MPLPAHDTVDIWWIDLDRVSLDASIMSKTLSVGEATRSMVMPIVARRRFIVMHYALRSILSGYTGTLMAEIEIRRNQSGKPDLLPARGETFSLSHSGLMGVIAITEHRDIGIDVEPLSRAVDYAGLRQRVLGPNEQREIDRLRTRADQHAAYVRSWVRKEAVLKASGHGLSHSPRIIDVRGASAEPVLVLDQHGDWLVTDIALPDPEWVVALAVSSHGEPPQIRCREWRSGASVSQGRSTCQRR